MKALRGLGRRVGANATRILRLAGARTALGPSGDEPRRWLLLRIGPVIPEQRTPPFGRDRALALIDVLRTVEAAAVDPRIAGVVMRVHGAPLGWSQAASLRRALVALREAGKGVRVWCETLDAPHFYAATAAERIELPPSGSLQLVGLRVQQLFVRDLLRNLDVRPEVVRIGTHKAAAEMLTRDSMSEEQRAQIEGWQDDVYEELVAGIAEGRGLDREAVKRAIDEGPYPAAEAAERGLIDGCLYPDELEAQLRGEAGEGADDDAPPLVDAATYCGVHTVDPGWRPFLRELPRIAYVVARGPVARGRGARGIGSQRYSELLAGLRRDDEVCGVVIRVDSPGGDAVASDLLHRSVERLGAEKPVVVSMGGVAASGGYYLAAGAHTVLAEKATLTGSIGVVGGKLDLDGLYRRLGIATDAVEHGARAGMLSETRGFTPDERSALQREMRAIYATFVDRVASGRSLERAAVERAAQGRVYSGVRAQALGLVDAIGGPLEALAEVRRQAALGDTERFLLDVHPRRLLLGDLRALVGAEVAGLRGRVTLT